MPKEVFQKIITKNLLLEEDKKELNHLSCFSEMLQVENMMIIYDELSLSYNPLSSITAHYSCFNIQSAQLPFIFITCRNSQMSLITHGNPCPQSSN